MELEETAKRCDETIRRFKSLQRNHKDPLGPADSARSHMDSSAAVDGNSVTARSGGETSRSGVPNSARSDSGAPVASARGCQESARHSSRMPPIEEKPVMEYDVATLKALGAMHPELLEKYRALRAADFVRKQSHLLDPPTHRSMSNEDVFRPAGNAGASTVLRHPPKELTKGKRPPIGDGRQQSVRLEPVDTARIEANIGNLMDQLSKTQEEIERQELKIALKSKTKSYELPKAR